MASMMALVLMAAVGEGTAGGTGVTDTDTTAPASAPVEPTAEEKAAIEAKKAELHARLKEKFNDQVDIKETSFHFRKVTNEVKNNDGTISKIETKRPTVVLPIPVPSAEGLVEIIGGGGKGLDLLLEAAAAVIMEQAREFINANDPVTEANFPFEKMGWEYIANLPKAERRGGGISKEVWEDFAKDYIEVMPAVTGKKKEQVEMAAKVFVLKFAGATTNKPVLKVLKDQLALYATNTTQGEQFAQCIEFLSDKVDKLLTTDETNLLNAL